MSTWALLLDRTPASAEVIEAVDELTAEVDLDTAGVLRLRLGISPEPTGWRIADAGTFDRLTRLTLLVAAGPGVPTPVVDATVVETAVSFADEPGGSVLEVVALDATAAMNLEDKVRTWPNMPDFAIAAAIFAEHGLVPVTEPTAPVRTMLDTTVVQRDTDIRFLRHLAHRNGFEVFVAPTPVPGVVEGHFRKPLLDVPAQAVLTVGMGDASNVASVEVRHERARPSAVDVAGVDVAGVRATEARAAAASVRVLGSAPALSADARRTRLDPGGLAGRGELEALAQGAADRSAWALTATGEADTAVLGTVLRPGVPVLVRGIGRRYSGTWEVASVRHQLTADRHVQHFRLRRNASGLTGAEAFLPDLALPG